MIFGRTRFDTPCTVEVEHSFDHLHAHVVLDGGIAIGPGDKVLVHGAAIRVPFGEAIRERRVATVTRANALERWWNRVRGDFDLTEMYEIGFSAGARS
jgi:hypothetical protein